MAKVGKTGAPPKVSETPSGADRPLGLSTADTSEPREFPLVGIGSSAGGLEAMEKFFAHVPANSGMAFVVIQHIDPTQKTLLPDLLQRAT